MTFEEKLRRNAPEDQIEIGQIVDDGLAGNFGNLLRCIINGIVAEQLARSRQHPGELSADRALGRIEALDQLTERLDVVIDIKNQLTMEKKEEQKIDPANSAPPTA